MKLATSGSRGVFFRANPRGTQETKGREGGRVRGDWWARWTCPHGHLHRALVGPKSIAVQEVQRKRLERPCPARQVKPTMFLLTDVIAEYLATTGSHKRSQADDARYGRTWAARFPGRTMEEIKPAELERIRVERLAMVSPATANREYAFLKHVFNIAVRDGKTETNPVAKLRMLREPGGRTRYLSDEEEARLLAALPTVEDRDRIITLLHTGFRRSELLNLRWRDVDFKAGILTVPKSKNGETRHVPMNSAVRDVLAKRPRPIDREGLVFPSRVGTPDLRWAKKAVPRALADAQIEDFRFHDLRHTFASRLAMAGVDLATLRELMGHKTMAMTLRYRHVSPDHRKAAIERLVARETAKESTPALGAH